LASSAVPAVQPSLFDRRAIREADARGAVLVSIDDHLRHTASLVAPHGEARHIETRVLVVLPVGGAAS
ncbi:MAG: hypothetical protein OEW19_00815, partial [Acidobacteriota bacterium]|nr:hypothetical protein [Acidobacteriota bacterium]